MIEEHKYTPLSELGEFGLIEHLSKSVKLYHKSSRKGIGDDAAVLNHQGQHTVLTTDLLIEGVHFDLMYVPLKHLGYKAVIVNLSDVYAMNARPRQITVSIAASNRFSLEAIESIYEGIRLACERYQVDLVGGDTTSSRLGLVISITATGVAPEEEIVYRDGAKANELICVSGDLGGAYLGLQLLEREKEVFKVNPNMQPELTGYDYVLERQLKPEARRDIICILQELNIKASSMIDISDGLSSDIIHLCRASKTGCKIFEDKIPIADEVKDLSKEFHIDPSIPALNGGEDYELLFTLPLDQREKLTNHPDISIIGHMTETEGEHHLVARDGTEISLNAQGWNALLHQGGKA